MIRTCLMAITLMLALVASQPLMAGSLEEIDRRIQAGKSREDLLRVASLIREALLQAKGSVSLTWRMAKVFYHLGNRSEGGARKDYYRQCVEQAGRAVNLNEESAIGYFLRGLCLGKQGELEGIWTSLSVIEPLQRDMETALRIDPSVFHGGPHRALGVLYLELPFFLGGDVQKSIGHLKQAVRYAPRYAENHLRLARAYYENQEYRAARDSLATLFQLTRDSADDEDDQKLRAQGNELMERIKDRIDS